ncbi:MAG: hypothetical protein ACXVGN_04865, partial [Mycobacteriaceae bacterium]
MRRAGVKAMTSLFADIDVHLTPTALTGALRLGEDFGSLINVVNTPYWNSVGYPAMSIPMSQTTETTVAVLLQAAGLTVAPSELDAFVAMYPAQRAALDSLFEVLMMK